MKLVLKGHCIKYPCILAFLTTRVNQMGGFGVRKLEKIADEKKEKGVFPSEIGDH